MMEVIILAVLVVAAVAWAIAGDQCHKARHDVVTVTTPTGFRTFFNCAYCGERASTRSAGYAYPLCARCLGIPEETNA